MNSTEFTYLLRNPENIDIEKTEQLDEIINEFPYFQSARALQLSGLNKSNSFKYNQALKKTATYTIDRNILFDFITSAIFRNTPNQSVDILEELEVIEGETIEILHKKITDSLATEKQVSDTLEIDTGSIKIVTEKATELLEIGKPIQFKSSEPHSFNEWMQLISKKPISREDKTHLKQDFQREHSEIIEKFIELNPKIKPVDKHLKNIDISGESSIENDHLMTETLAKVYLEQKKYESAVKAYRILSLKYPEKSGFFADRIKAIKILQSNKS